MKMAKELKQLLEEFYGNVPDDVDILALAEFIYANGYKQAINDTVEWLSEIDNGTTITDIKAFIDAYKRDMVG